MAEILDAVNAFMDSKAFGVVAILALGAWEWHREKLRHREAMNRIEEANAGRDAAGTTAKYPGHPG